MKQTLLLVISSLASFCAPRVDWPDVGDVYVMVIAVVLARVFPGLRIGA
ncbi:hypothetical protein [uncultured Tateyamaria sp.]|nr:hypothetical protein [uncultured Tateyamaria sp.]